MKKMGDWFAMRQLEKQREQYFKDCVKVLRELGQELMNDTSKLRSPVKKSPAVVATTSPATTKHLNSSIPRD